MATVQCRAPMALTSGTKLGPYEIIAPLGAGGISYRRTRFSWLFVRGV
jgi:hypothetical protein